MCSSWLDDYFRTRWIWTNGIYDHTLFSKNLRPICEWHCIRLWTKPLPSYVVSHVWSGKYVMRSTAFWLGGSHKYPFAVTCITIFYITLSERRLLERRHFWQKGKLQINKRYKSISTFFINYSLFRPNWTFLGTYKIFICFTRFSSQVKSQASGTSSIDGRRANTAGRRRGDHWFCWPDLDLIWYYVNIANNNRSALKQLFER